MDLYDYNTIKRILTRHGFTFSKALGQNFLIDPSVSPRMAAALEADDRTGALRSGRASACSPKSCLPCAVE